MSIEYIRKAGIRHVAKSANCNDLMSRLQRAKLALDYATDRARRARIGR